jgi:hypothetical protein
VRNSGQRIENADWFAGPGPVRPDSASQMDDAIHTEQRLTAMHKMFDTPFGIEYIGALRRCVRLNAQLGFVDAGVPMAQKLLDLVTDGDYPPDLVAESCREVGTMAHACRRVGRFAEALTLDDAVAAWFAEHRRAFGHGHVAAVAGLATDHAGLGDLDRAVAILRAELDDPLSPVRLHPLGRQAVRFAALAKQYERRRTRDQDAWR